MSWIGMVGKLSMEATLDKVNGSSGSGSGSGNGSGMMHDA